MNRRLSRSVIPTVAIALSGLLVACSGGSASPNMHPSGATPAPTQPDASRDATAGGSGSPVPAASTGPAAPSPTPVAGNPTNPPPPPEPTNAPQGKTIVRAYFHLDGYGLVPVLREVDRTRAVARASLEELLRGPGTVSTEDPVNMSTAIPSTTRLLGLSIENGTATVDLSSDFEGGGGSASTIGRLQQVVYTLTQFPSVERVAFRLEGQDATVFGSEGLVLERPQTREDFFENLPPIWTDRPAWAASMASGSEVSGLANVFEATFHVAALDAAGDVLFEEPVMASCGSGCWGSFSVDVEYEVDEAQWGRLRTYNLSARDGSIEQVHDRPVWLTP